MQVDDVADRHEFNRTLQRLVSCGNAESCVGALKVIGAVVNCSSGPHAGEVELQYILDLIRMHSVAPQSLPSTANAASLNSRPLFVFVLIFSRSLEDIYNLRFPWTYHKLNIVLDVIFIYYVVTNK